MSKKNSSQKPKLGLVPGNQALDVEALRKLYVSMTGKEPTKEEIKQVEERLKKEK